MKYFTPERWLRFQNVADEQAFHSAHAEWRNALAGYRKGLAEIREQLTPSLRRFTDSQSLHDALVVAIWQERNRLTLLVKPEPPADHYVLLNYTLVGSVSVNLSALPPEYQTKHAGWMYDEIGVEAVGAQASSDHAERENRFVHSILLSNGWEMTIPFCRFSFSRPEALFPVPQGELGLPRAFLPQSA